ncbi:MAG: NAD(P)H-dependent oxidoreductase, partial [Lentisphaerae bacterium]|nr:NAD(P)H-dependent oxidoreductase [Lentisphaerota bacterium]
RPWGESVWNGKPAGVISLSQGGIGGFGANHHLRQTLACLNVPVMAQPEAYLGRIQESFEENQNSLKPDTREFLANFLRQFAVWVTRNQS